MNMSLRPLGKVRDIVQSTGLDISYAYDDLVFSDHSVFILRFDNRVHEKLYLHFNTECNREEAEIFEISIVNSGKIGGIEIIKDKNFVLKQKEGKEEIDIEFL